MNAMIEYFNGGHNSTDLLLALAVIIAIIISIEKGIRWIYQKFLLLYRTKKGYEDEATTINNNTEQIKNLVVSIENLGELLNKQYQHLDKKIDDQKERITKIDEDGKKRDCALMRDRILGGMRYFCKNVDENGVVHISMADHENMSHLFEEYFKCGGNGSVKHLFDMEFSKFKIDNE